MASSLCDTTHTKRGTWVTVSNPMHADFPPVACCYVFIFDNKWVYVGSTMNLKLRMRGYKLDFNYDSYVVTPWGTAKSFVLKYKPSVWHGDWAMHELRLIKKLQPRLNATHSVRRRNGRSGLAIGTSKERSTRFQISIEAVLRGA